MLEKIGGLVKHLGWDTIDEIKAQYHGWKTRSYEEQVIIHHKVTGKNTGVFKWALKLGQSDYYCGYHPLFLLAKGVRRLFLPPYVLGGVGILWGYFRNYFRIFIEVFGAIGGGRTLPPEQHPDLQQRILPHRPELFGGPERSGRHVEVVRQYAGRLRLHRYLGQRVHLQQHVRRSPLRPADEQFPHRDATEALGNKKQYIRELPDPRRVRGERDIQ